MANPKHLENLKGGVEAWNRWRQQNKEGSPNLCNANLEGADLSGANSALAWALATAEDSTIRDGRSAVEFAEKATAATNRKIPAILDTLAAAYAENGEFEKAVSVQKEAIALLKKEEEIKTYDAHLQLFEHRTPCRDRE